MFTLVILEPWVFLLLMFFFFFAILGVVSGKEPQPLVDKLVKGCSPSLCDEKACPVCEWIN